MNITGLEGDLLMRLLEASSMRARVISSNIANQNTPGYERKEVHFEDLLRAATDKASGDLSRISPQVEVDSLTPARADGNNVSLEEEMNTMRENRILFETYATILQNRLGLIETSIRGGR